MQGAHVAGEFEQVVGRQAGKGAYPAVAGDKGQAAAVLEVAETVHIEQVLPAPAGEQPGDLDVMAAQRLRHRPGAADMALAGTLYPVKYLHVSLFPVALR